MSAHKNLTPPSPATWQSPLGSAVRWLLYPLNRYGVIGLLIVVGVFLLIFVQHSTSPYTIDEAAFPYGAEGILKNGAPFFYNGETRPNDLGLWHPPLYIYSLALNMLLFGSSHVSTRLFGAICVIFALFVMFRIAKQLTQALPQWGYVALAALFLLNPLILSGTLVPDIDGTVGLVAVAFGILLAIRISRYGFDRRFIVYASLTWLLLLYTKFVLAILLIPILFLAVLLASSDRPKRLVALVVGLLLGTSLFFLTYLPFARIAGFPASAPFDYFRENFQRGHGAASFVEGILTHLSPGGGVFYFLTPSLITASIFAFVVAMTTPRTGASRRAVVLLALAAVWIVFFYSAITGSPYTFPKYWGVAVIPLALLATLLSLPAQKALRSLHGWPPNVLQVAILAATSLGALAIFVWVFHRLCLGLVAANRDLHALILASIAMALLVGVGTLLLPLAKRQTKLPINLVGSVSLALIVTAGATSLCVDFANRSTPVSTRYYLSERGLQEAIDEIRAVTSIDDLLIAPKDIGLQSGRRFFEDAALLGLSEADLRAALSHNPAKFLVTRNKWDYSSVVFPGSFLILKEFFAPLSVQQSPDIVIWERKSVAQP